MGYEIYDQQPWLRYGSYSQWKDSLPGYKQHSLESYAKTTGKAQLEAAKDFVALDPFVQANMGAGPGMGPVVINASINTTNGDFKVADGGMDLSSAKNIGEWNAFLNGTGGAPATLPKVQRDTSAWAEGSLLHDREGKIWLVVNEQRWHVPDPDTFNAMGLRWDLVMNVDPNRLAAIPVLQAASLAPDQYVRL